MEFKREAIEYAEKNSYHKAAEKFHVAVKRMREWRQNKLKIPEPAVTPKNKRLEGGRRKPLDLQLENQLVEWIYDRRSNRLRVSGKLIMAKPKYFYESECDESEKFLFVVSNGWVNNFMRRNSFSLRRKTAAKQDPEQLIDILTLYNLHARMFSIKYKHPSSSIIAMDKISIWNDMVSNTTINKQGAKSVCLKTTGYEKCMVSICLAARADRTKLKPFVVFRERI